MMTIPLKMRLLMQIRVEWDLDGLSPAEAGVPEIVTLPEELPINKDVSDYLSDTYGWCVFHWSYIEEFDPRMIDYSMNVWLVRRVHNGVKHWLELRDQEPLTPSSLCLHVNEGKSEKRIKCPLTDRVAGKHISRSAFSAGLIRTDFNRLIRFVTWDTKEELDAALKAGDLVSCGWGKTMLLELRDLRGLQPQ